VKNTDIQIGQRYERWIVLDGPVREKNVATKWLCRCDCGIEKLVAGTNLLFKKSRSCGCLGRELTSQRSIKNLIGQKFGKLTVIERVDKPNDSRHKDAYYLCQCDCGGSRIVKSSHLRKGVASCGCIRKERASKLTKREFGQATRDQLFKTYKKSARTRSLEFNLEEEYFFKLTKQNCYYCGKEPCNVVININGNGNYLYNGIDRIDNKIGYTFENCVTCCKTCNYMKMKLTLDEFIIHIKNIYNYWINKGE
jgi:hypothetical protein